MERRPSPGPDSRSVPEAPAQDAAALATNRRDFLKLTTVGAAAIAGCDPDGSVGAPLSLRPSFTTTLLRPTDFVALTVGFVNLELRDGKLVRERNDRTAYLVVTHAPQHALERSFQETEPPGASSAPAADPLQAPPIDARLAGASRVVYVVPAGVPSIEFTTTGLLDAFARFEMSVPANALPADPPPLVFFPRPLLGDVAATTIDLVRPPTGATVAQALVSCTEDGRPPALTALNAAVAARNTRAYAYLARVSGVELLPNVSLPILNPAPLPPSPPASGETSLELPFRLSLSPNAYGQWAHALTPVQSKEITPGRVELWHTRLGVLGAKRPDGSHDAADEASSFYRTVRAMWTRDEGFSATDPTAPINDGQLGFDAALVPRDRRDIVHQSANFAAKSVWPGYRPTPVQVNRLMLTALGGWLDVRGDWGDTPRANLSVWEHRATFGRDHYVKIVRTGVLYPFGHRAVVITISERKLKRESTDSHPHVAYVRKRSFIVVKQPVMKYEDGRTANPTTEPLLRQQPFTAIHFKTLSTPPLDAVGSAFVPHVSGAPLRFAVEGVDLAGNVVSFSTPVAFIATTAPDGKNPVPVPGGVTTARGLYDDEDFTFCDLSGQRMAYAPFAAGTVDDTTYETRRLRFVGNDMPYGSAGYKLPFLPAVAEAELAVEAMRQLVGAAGQRSFRYHEHYLANGFGGANAGELLLRLSDDAPPLEADFGNHADQSGGLVAPSLAITALSRALGPVGGDPLTLKNTIGAGKFNANDFFKGVEAKLFGTFDLFDLIPESALDRAPKFITQSLDQVEELLEDAKRLQQQLTSLGYSADALVAKLAAVLGDLDDLVHLETAKLKTDLAALAAALGAVETNVRALPGPEGPKKAATAIANRVRGILADVDAFVALVDRFRHGVELAKQMRVRLEWHPRIQPIPAGKPIFEPHDTEKGLTLAAEVRGKAAGGKQAGVDLVCALENFQLNLIAPVTFLSLPFKKVEFKVESGKKPDIDVQMGSPAFGGVLEFVDTLRKVIPLNGFSDPPAIDVSTSGIKASFSVALPSVAIGVFALTNVSLGGGFEIPFIGKPLTVSFNFCTREHPFSLTVSMLGGGGFFGMTLYAKGVYMMEGAFELGAALSLDFGVASGSVEVKAGIYFKMELEKCTLSGYLRIRGEVDVLGLITASIEMRMELTYDSGSGKVIGRATIEIEVEVLFFSATVSVSAERRFAGSKGDPTFEQIMGPEPSSASDPLAPWAEYVNAFAA